MAPEQIEPFARATVTALGIGVLESAALAALVWAMSALRPRPSATTRHVLWWLALTAAAVLPVVSVIGSLGHIEHHARASVAAERVPFILVRGRAAGVGDGSGEGVPPQSAARIPSTTRTPTTPTISLAALAAAARTTVAQLVNFPYLGLSALALWLVVAVAGCGRLAAGLVSLARIKRNAAPLDENVVRRLRRWRHSARAGRAVRLAVSNEVDVPVAVGFRTPTILFPIRVVETEEIADIDQIAMHEYAHLDRYDDWTNLFQRVLERIFWFNPVVQLVGRRIALEREISCDDWVVAQTGRAHRYATCLWKLVESSRLPAKPILAPGALLSTRQITTRIEQLLDGRRNALPRLSPLGAVCVAGLCVAAVVVQVQRAPKRNFSRFAYRPQRSRIPTCRTSRSYPM
jgi:beta-lactamase regulating signal transducer with metallopeptidase domain